MSASVVRENACPPTRAPLRSDRPLLRLVGPGERVDPAGRGGQLRSVYSPAHGVVRLNLRGWLVITLMATAAAVVLAVMLAASVDASPPRIDHAITVLAGQTLSEVAATQLPMLSIRDAVARIQLVNDLSSLQVHAGQSLLIPAIR